jgi:hypothetical protein
MQLTIFTVWADTSWAATLIRSDLPPTRWMVLGVMLSGLIAMAVTNELVVAHALGRTSAPLSLWLVAGPIL